MVEGDQHLKQEACIAACHPLVEMHATDYAKASETGSNVEHSVGLAEDTEEDRFKGTSGRTHLQ